MEVELKKPEKEFDMEWHPTPEGKSIPLMRVVASAFLIDFLKIEFGKSYMNV